MIVSPKKKKKKLFSCTHAFFFLDKDTVEI